MISRATLMLLGSFSVALLMLSTSPSQALRIYAGGASLRQFEEMMHEIEMEQQRQFLLEESKKTNGNIWVVLVAGSDGYYNYRHQADICHAYHVVKSHGVPEANIITMMKDDIAHNPSNPNKGVIINKPGGKDVYGGVVIDFKGKEVTPENFLKVLTGDPTLKASGKKVLESDSEDRVFVFFSDHGAPGLIAFPSDVLHATDLAAALKTMNQKNMYKELVFYLEACESGSMFDKGLLPATLNIYALTAANAAESSYACYYVDSLQTYVGDCFSVAWMEDSDSHNIQTITLQEQYQRVKAITTESHVMQYGALNFTSEVVGNFQGTQNPASTGRMNLNAMRRVGQAVPQEEVELHILLNKHRSANSLEEQMEHWKAIQEHLQVREKTTALFERILTILHGNNPYLLENMKTRRANSFINFKCYVPVVRYFSEICMPLNASSPALNHLYKLANLCQLGSAPERIIRALRTACQQ